MLKNNAHQVRSGWFIFITCLSMLVSTIIFTIPGSMLFEAFLDRQFIDIDESELLGLLNHYPWFFLLIQGGGVVGGLLVVLLLWRFMNKQPIKNIGLKGSFKDMGFGLLLGAVSITIIFFILLITGDVTLLSSLTKPIFSIYTITFFILFVLVSLSEEVFFRGYIISTMMSRGNRKWLIYFVSAIIFSAAHMTNPNVSGLGLINIALVGVLFAYMFFSTDSLWLPIGYHFTWNYFQGNVFGFSVSGLDTHGMYDIEVSAGNKWLTGGAFGLEGGILATVLILLGFLATMVYSKIKET